jgi:hypothetical protein
LLQCGKPRLPASDFLFPQSTEPWQRRLSIVTKYNPQLIPGDHRISSEETKLLCNKRFVIEENLDPENVAPTFVLRLRNDCRFSIKKFNGTLISSAIRANENQIHFPRAKSGPVSVETVIVRQRYCVWY